MEEICEEQILEDTRASSKKQMRGRFLIQELQEKNLINGHNTSSSNKKFNSFKLSKFKLNLKILMDKDEISYTLNCFFVYDVLRKNYVDFDRIYNEVEHKLKPTFFPCNIIPKLSDLNLNQNHPYDFPSGDSDGNLNGNHPWGENQSPEKGVKHNTHVITNKKVNSKIKRCNSLELSFHDEIFNLSPIHGPSNHLENISFYKLQPATDNKKRQRFATNDNISQVTLDTFKKFSRKSAFLKYKEHKEHTNANISSRKDTHSSKKSPISKDSQKSVVACQSSNLNILYSFNTLVIDHPLSFSIYQQALVMCRVFYYEYDVTKNNL